MKKKLLIELINHLEEHIYTDKENPSDLLTLSHLYYFSSDKKNFIKTLGLFYKKSKEKNLFELEKIAFHDQSFVVVIREELLFYLEGEYVAGQWDSRFSKGMIDFLETVGDDLFPKPYILCEILKNQKDNVDIGNSKKALKNILTGYTGTRWELTGLRLFTENMGKHLKEHDFRDQCEKEDFIKEYKENLQFFANKFPEDSKASEYLFALCDYFMENELYDEAIKLYSRISDLYRDDHIKVRVLYELGMIYHIKGETTKTVEIYTEMFTNFETRKDLVEIKFLAAEFLADNDYYKNAYLIFREICRRFRNTRWAERSSRYILDMACNLYKEGKYSEALTFFDELLSIRNSRDHTSSARFHKGLIFRELANSAFSYDERISYDVRSDEIFRKIVRDYNDNPDILSRIPSEYLRENNSVSEPAFDFNYILLTAGIVILMIVIFLKMV